MLKKFLNKIIAHIELHLAFNRLSRIWKTIYVNFRTFCRSISPGSCRFTFMGRPTLYSLAGNIEIKGPIRRGMIMFDVI